VSEEIAAREIAAEQDFVDRVYVQLEQSAAAAQELMREGHERGRLGHEGGLVERDAMTFQAAKRIAQLDAAHEGLVFGRLDLTATIDPAPRYIGRIGLRDTEHESLLIDWRAPAAGVFYQATAAEPQGVVRRRVLRSTGQRVQGVEDELLDPEDPRAEDLPIVGEGALMAQLSRARDRSMHSIVATIQAEQDRAIRAPGRSPRGGTVVEISGGPGTGKTVVALHRAAYLLYSDRRRYESGGVLVVGPSGVFMRYIERVLPSLGETAVALRSLGEVVDGVRATRHDEPAVAAVKGAASMAEVLRRTSRLQVPGSPDQFRVFYRDDVLVLDRRILGNVRRSLMSRGPRNRELPRVAKALLDQLWRQVRGERGRELGREAFDDEMLGTDAFVDFAASWWPPLAARDALAWLRDPDVLARVADGLLDADAQALLVKSWGAHPDLSVDDVPLLDELRYALGDVPDRRDEESAEAWQEPGADLQELTTAADREFAPGGRSWTPPANRVEDDAYAHVLVDEAQDLTPMQWRMVGRRGRTASWTIVGDPAQSSWPVPAESAAARRQALEGKTRHAFHLSTNYRNSAEIYDHAAAYARRVGLDADLPTAVRSTGVPPREVAAGDDLEAVVRAEVDAVAGQVTGTVGIVVPVARRSEVNNWLAAWPERAADAPGARAAAADSTAPPSGTDRVVVLTGLDTKGLEFDAIVVVRPQEIEDESPTGRATLYVVLTRATQLLTVVA
jgi:DNA helicase IV